MSMNAYLAYRAYKTLELPDGILPPRVLANEVVSIHVEDLKRSRALQNLIASGALRAEPAVATPKPPTAQELLGVLKLHPTLYEEIKQHFLREERKATTFKPLSETVRRNR